MSITQIEQIKQLIAQGENSAVEFKNSEVRPESLAREIVSFANSSGGTILIGVEDSGKIAAGGARGWPPPPWPWSSKLPELTGGTG